jgi:hypothetical protein
MELVHKNFVSACLENESVVDEIDDCVEYWHTHEINISFI